MEKSAKCETLQKLIAEFNDNGGPSFSPKSSKDMLCGAIIYAHIIGDIGKAEKEQLLKKVEQIYNKTVLTKEGENNGI
ncbi:MAG: hypothetical protein IJO74_06390 [Clostridia bacterium]|nr:hypothetical protein [Clostridia bacterium]